MGRRHVGRVDESHHYSTASETCDHFRTVEHVTILIVALYLFRT